jgi:hypothetical protein
MCHGSGDPQPGDLWNDVCPACGGLGLVPQSELDELNTYIDRNRNILPFPAEPDTPTAA